jgi:hypothetical protein
MTIIGDPAQIDNIQNDRPNTIMNGISIDLEQIRTYKEFESIEDSSKDTRNKILLRIMFHYFKKRQNFKNT